MSNPMKSSECIYPECGPTCRKNCPPLPTKPEPIEPTEEQWKTVFDVIDGNWMDGPSEVMRQVARLLAERDAKLRAELKTERLVAEKALVARNAIENERDAARRDLARADGYLLAGQKSEMAMKSQLADARARVAELEAREKFRDLAAEVDTGEPVDVLLMRTLSARVAELEASIVTFHGAWKSAESDVILTAKRVVELEAYEPNWKTHSAQIEKIEQLEEREAQHLADIKALQILLHRWVSSYVGGRHGEDARSLVDVTYRALTGAPLSHYDEMDAPASTEGGEG